MNTSSKTVTRHGYHRLAFPPEPPMAIVEHHSAATHLRTRKLKAARPQVGFRMVGGGKK